MDEEQNNEQNLGQKASQDIQDTTNAVKDGADLAKNVSTGNVLGAVKDGVKLIGNKKVRRTILVLLLIPIIVIVALGMSLFSVFGTIGDTIQNVVHSFIDLFKIVDDWDGSIKIKDEDISKVIKEIENLGFDMDDLWLLGDIEKEDTDNEETLKKKQEEAAKKYIRKFLEAQLVTETPHYEPVIASGNAYNQKTYGQVYIYRANDQEYINENSKATPMSWMSYSTMQEEAAKNNEKGLNAIKNHYSIDDEGKLVIAQWTKIETTGKADEVIISLKHIDYKSAISQYTTPMNFFIYLTMVSQNPEFVSAVTDMVKNSRIELTIMDTKTVNVEEEKYSFTRNTKTTHETKRQGVVINTYTTSRSRGVEQTTTTTTTTVVPTPKITYAKTWFSEQRITYKIANQDPYHNYEKYTENEDSSLADDAEPGDPQANGSTSWNTNKCREITTDVTGTTYKEETRGNVIDKTGEKGSNGVTQDSYKNERRQVKNNFTVDDKTTFLGLLDDYFKIPNSNRYEAAGKTNMVGGAEWLFGLMEKDGRLQNLEQVMRYVMYKYTGKEYGVKELDLSIFNIRDFSDLTSVGLKVKVGETGAPEALTKQQIEEIISKRFSGEAYNNLMSAIDAFMEIQNRYHVNAVFAIAVAQKESSCGVNWAAIDPSTHNWYSIRGDYNGNSIDGWRKYPSFKEAVNDFGKLIGTSSYYFGGGNITIGNIGKSYCPPGDEWSRGVSQFVKEMYESIGITIYAVGGNELQAKVVEVAQNSASYGISAQAGYCQAWVYQVYYKAGACPAGTSVCCAVHAGQKWGVSTDWSQIQVGATVYGYSGSKYGHVGIYIGDGIVAHNVGGVAFTDLDEWIKTYKGVCWGWNGVDLTGGAYPFTPGLIVANHRAE
ncbi:MAG: hypothetical protein UGE22_01870 [Clostridia bacterium]|nr:hypothetical protein [Clostridia bacterium]DAK87727.1 MAG TPA: Mannosyl-glycoprotein endo-beta-N-acetylglucosaminidase [Bacteriophage sp.]